MRAIVLMLVASGCFAEPVHSTTTAPIPVAAERQVRHLELATLGVAINRSSVLVGGYETGDLGFDAAFYVEDPITHQTATRGVADVSDPDHARDLEARVDRYLANGGWYRMLPATRGADDTDEGVTEHWTVPQTSLEARMTEATGALQFSYAGVTYDVPQARHASPSSNPTCDSGPGGIRRLDYDPATQVVWVVYKVAGGTRCPWVNLYNAIALPFRNRVPYPHAIEQLAGE